MIRQGDGSGAVVLAHHLVREDRAQQVLGAHALDLHGYLLAAAEPFHRQRPARVPAPAVGEHGRRQGRLGEVPFHRSRFEVGEDRVEREGVAVGQRDHDAVVGGRGLKLEVEVDAEAFAQRQPPGAVDASAEGRVQHQLHAPGLVEEPFGDDTVHGGHAAEHGAGLVHVGDDLFGARRPDPGFALKPPAGRFPLGRPLRDGLPHVRHRARQLQRASRRLPQPERYGRRRAVGVLHPHLARRHPLDAPRGVAEQEDVARQALDGEVLVDLAHEGFAVRLHHVVVGGVGDGAPVGDGDEPGAPACPQHAVHAVPVEMGAAPPSGRRHSFAQHV